MLNSAFSIFFFFFLNLGVADVHQLSEDKRKRKEYLQPQEQLQWDRREMLAVGSNLSTVGLRNLRDTWELSTPSSRSCWHTCWASEFGDKTVQCAQETQIFFFFLVMMLEA